MLEKETIDDIKKRQDKILNESIITDSSWATEAILRLGYPVVKAFPSGTMLGLVIPYSYQPKFAVHKHSESAWDISEFFPESIPILLVIQFTSCGYFDGVYTFYSEGIRFHHYHGGSGTDKDCVGGISIPSISKVGKDVIDNLKSALDLVVVDSVTDSSPKNHFLSNRESIYYSMPSTDALNEKQGNNSSLTAWSIPPGGGDE